MMRFKLKEKFDGVNEYGLTFEEVVAKDLKDHIDSFFFYRERIFDKKGDLDALNTASVSNARYVISCYYYKYLDEFVSGELAKKLKKEIEERMTLEELMQV